MRRLVTLIVLVLGLSTGMAPANAAHQLAPQDRYLFVEAWSETNGAGSLPSLVVDFPSYHFDPSTGKLRPYFSGTSLPNLANNAVGFAGAGQSRRGAAGGGVASNLDVIDSLPYTTSIRIGTTQPGKPMEQWRSAALELLSVDGSGTLSARIDGQSVTLPAGASWTRVVTSTTNTSGFSGVYTMTSRLTNYGWQDRALIAYPTTIWMPFLGHP